MQYLRDIKLERRGRYLPRVQATFARFTEIRDFNNASAALENTVSVASPDGDPMQMVVTYSNKGLAYRLVKNPLPTLEQQYDRKLFIDFCPFLKFSYLITNQAIVEAMKREQVFHIIDLNACDATQWIYLLHTLKEQRQGDQLLIIKITGIHKNKDVLEQIEFQLIQEAQKMNIPLHFSPIVSQLEKLCFEKLPLKPGEPLAISSILHLHSLLAVDDQISPDSVLPPNSLHCVSPKMRWFLSSLWKLQPKLMVITEKESDNNGHSLTDRLDKALNFYTPLFDCLEASVPKEKAEERIILERMLLGEEIIIKNIIIGDGFDRKERHGKFLKTWHPLLDLAGFRRVPIDYETMLQVTRPLQSYGSGYKLLDFNQYSPRQEDLRDMNVKERALYLVHLLKTCARYTDDDEFKKATAGLELVIQAKPDRPTQINLSALLITNWTRRLTSIKTETSVLSETEVKVTAGTRQPTSTESRPSTPTKTTMQAIV
ncbi:GRAS family protein TF80-like [Prosopis cineraria]|uniref:GRAS family protein TF80-like n=1 Tax=Prosopis cineraria TaxID=364024 RepID=UPI002410ABA1|nr:GRAS family protein TF80-like [Prosopis cineraria]